jgi:hypothetical protein
MTPPNLVLKLRIKVAALTLLHMPACMHAQGQLSLHIEVWKFQPFSVTKTKFCVPSPFVDYKRAVEVSAVQ